VKAEINVIRLQQFVQRLRTGQARSHFCNPACCNSPRQNQQLCDHSQPLSASAIDSESPCTGNKPSGFEKNQRPNDSEQKYYLCDYQYEGEKWCIEIPADSWQDAQARLSRLAYGRVVGEIKATIPASLGPLAKLWVWIADSLRP
jgi:hypothetical protein